MIIFEKIKTFKEKIEPTEEVLKKIAILSVWCFVLDGEWLMRKGFLDEEGRVTEKAKNWRPKNRSRGERGRCLLHPKKDSFYVEYQLHQDGKALENLFEVAGMAVTPLEAILAFRKKVKGGKIQFAEADFEDQILCPRAAL